MRSAPSDDDLLELLRQVEDAPLPAAPLPETYPSEEVRGEPCPGCGNPAEHAGECHVCGMDGCLPPDLWSPGQPDPCLTLCYRCARTLHVACSVEDESGNPRCASCAF